MLLKGAVPDRPDQRSLTELPERRSASGPETEAERTAAFYQRPDLTNDRFVVGSGHLALSLQASQRTRWERLSVDLQWRIEPAASPNSSARFCGAVIRFRQVPRRDLHLRENADCVVR